MGTNSNKEIRRLLPQDNRDLVRSLSTISEDQPDRTIAIVGVSIVEALISRTLLSCFIADPISEELAHSNSLDLKLKLATAVGVISDWERSTMRCMGDIRNWFAHDWQGSRTFETEEVRKLCVDTLFRLLKEAFPDYRMPEGPRDIFFAALDVMAVQLHDRPDSVKKCVRNEGILSCGTSRQKTS